VGLLYGLPKYDKIRGFQNAAVPRPAVAKHQDNSATVLQNKYLALHQITHSL